MNSVIENIKFKPRRFIFMFVIPAILIIVCLAIFKTSTFTFWIGAFWILIIFQGFNTSVSSEILNDELNNIIKEKGITKEQLFEITGLTKYEVTERNGHYDFYFSGSKMKKYLKMLKNYDA
ncbi:hypothetical protein [Mammaliicoccus lentus]|uniref:hypothetical protein n=1 Tax=Mammaliicoccus lentus TaxID=42858 RepID=UPI0028E399B5|nr:hypothetical protein [Mammaliicoccus lentus]